VLRLLRGEELDALSQELGVTAARLSKWREMFRSAGMPSLKSRPRDGRDEEIARLKEVIGELTMRNELLREANRRLAAGLPLGLRRSRR
jgi:hypothetical protein